MYKFYQLKSGIKVLLVPYSSIQTVSVVVLVRAGSKYEKKETSGVSHFLEHMLFKGTKKRPNTIKIAEMIERIGGVFNAFTSTEYTGYYVKVASDFLGTAFEWISDIFFNSIIGAKEAKKERGVIIEEINMYNDDPMMKVQDLWRELLYKDQPAGWPISGTKESVSKIDESVVLKYLKKHYTGKNTLICVAGNFDALRAKKFIQKYFSSIAVGKKNQKLPTIEGQKKPKTLFFQKSTDQTHICLGVRAYNIFHPQRYSLILLGQILGGMMSSRLFSEIREKRGWAYYINTGVEDETDCGYLLTRAGINNENTPEAIKIILEEYKKMASKKISPQELSKAKNHLKGSLAIALESSDALAMFYGVQQIIKNKIQGPEDIFKEVDKIKESDILKTAKDVFCPEKLNLAAIGPLKPPEKFKKILNAF